MGLFDDQLKTRLEQDRESFADALEALGESVTGKAAVTGKNGSLEDAVHEILTWFGAKAPEPPGLMDDFNDRLDYMLNPAPDSEAGWNMVEKGGRPDARLHGRRRRGGAFAAQIWRICVA